MGSGIETSANNGDQRLTQHQEISNPQLGTSQLNVEGNSIVASLNKQKENNSAMNLFPSAHDIFNFTPGTRQTGTNEGQGDPKVSRPSDIQTVGQNPVEKPTAPPATSLDATQISPNGVEQGGAGDCFFEASLSSLASTAQGQEAIKNMVTTNNDGTYTVKFPGDPNHPVTVTQQDLDKAKQGPNAQVQDMNGTMAIVETAFQKYDQIG